MQIFHTERNQRLRASFPASNIRSFFMSDGTFGGFLKKCIQARLLARTKNMCSGSKAITLSRSSIASEAVWSGSPYIMSTLCFQNRLSC